MKKYVISLPESIERRHSVASLLIDIDFNFFDAENVKGNPAHFIYQFYDRSKTQKYKGYSLTKAELGCAASHIKLWKECAKQNQVFLIMEDNIELYGDLKSQLDNIEKYAFMYGLVKLGNVFLHKSKFIRDIDNQYKLVSQKRGGCGTSAYAISPETAKKYLKKIPHFFEPIDDFMDCEWRTGQTIYTYSPQLASRSEVTSTIGARKRKNSLSKKKKLYIEIYRLSRQFNQLFYNACIK